MTDVEAAKCGLPVEVVIQTIPYDEVASLSDKLDAESMQRLSALAVRHAGVWDAVRTSAYSFRDGMCFTRVGVFPYFTSDADEQMLRTGVAQEAIRRYLSETCIGSVQINVIETPVRYVDFSRLAPAQAIEMMRKLQIGRQDSFPGEVCDDHAQHEWPELRLVVFAVSRAGGWPIMTESQSALVHLLDEFGCDMANALEPDFVEFDVLGSAVKKWIDKLHEIASFIAWDVLPGGIDTALLLIVGKTDLATTQCQIQVRASQLSERGVEDVFRHVATTTGTGANLFDQCLQ